VAGKIAGESANASPMDNGEGDIPIIFGACIRSRSRPMALGPSIDASTASNIRSMFSATPPLSEDPGLAGKTQTPIL